MAHSEKETQGETLDKYFYVFKGWSKPLKITVAIIVLAAFMSATFYAGIQVGKHLVAEDPFVVYNNGNYSTVSDTTLSDVSLPENSVVCSSPSDDVSILEALPKSTSSAQSKAQTKSTPESKITSMVTSGKYTAYVNINSKTFHLSADCYHCKRMKDENKMEFHYDSVQEIIDSGFKPCGTCAKEYKE